MCPNKPEEWPTAKGANLLTRHLGEISNKSLTAKSETQK